MIHFANGRQGRENIISSKFSLNSITSVIVPQADGTAFLKPLVSRFGGTVCSFGALYCFYGDQRKRLALHHRIGIVS